MREMREEVKREERDGVIVGERFRENCARRL